MTFKYQHDQLMGEAVSLEAIAQAVGTPCYVYDLGRIRENYRRLRTAFSALDPMIHYSLKANANLTVIKTLLAEGSGLDAVSGGEIYRALAAGANPAAIVFAGVGKTTDELSYALDQRIGCFNVESGQELERLNALAIDRQRTATVALRLNPAVEAHTHHHIATGHVTAKFGISEDEARTVLSNMARYPALQIVGVHVHIGSQLESVAETETAARRALALIDSFPTLTRLNLGGGFPVPYNGEPYPPIEAFAAALEPLLKDRIPDRLLLGLEPGRYLVADAGALLVTVQYIKRINGQRVIVVDGGMTELIRPALYGARHPIQPLQAPEAETTIAGTAVVGPVCESADVLHPEALLPSTLQPGDRLAVLMVGAYGATMGSNYNARLRPPEIVIDGDQWSIARRRETWADLIRLEQAHDE